MDTDDELTDDLRAEFAPVRDAVNRNTETSIQQAIAPLIERIAALEDRVAELERVNPDDASTLGRGHP